MAQKTQADELFDDFKKKVLDDIKSGTENFDKNLLAFSSGALGPSLGGWPIFHHIQPVRTITDAPPAIPENGK